MTMPRMRFPAQALEELRRDDPNTPVTLHLIQTLARTGQVPFVPIGRRRLLNYDALVELLAHPEQMQTAAPASVGGVRRIPE